MDEVTKYALGEIYFYGKAHFGKRPTRLVCSPDKYRELRMSKDARKYFDINNDCDRTFADLVIVIDKKTPGIRAD